MSKVLLYGDAAIQTFLKSTTKSDLVFRMPHQDYFLGGQNAQLLRYGTQYFWWDVALAVAQ